MKGVSPEMPTVEEIVAYLRSEGLLAPSEADGTGSRVTHVASEEVATAGALSWLSSKRWVSTPERRTAFGGALLLLPPTAPSGPAGAGVGVSCQSPKLAFAKVVERFFPSLEAWPWPATGLREAGVAVDPTAKIGPGVILGAGVVIGPGVEVGPYTILAHTTVGQGTRIGAHCSIGLPGFGFERSEQGVWFRFPHVGRVEIGEEVEIGSNTCIDRGALGATRIGRGVKIDNLVHVAHNVTIEPEALIIAHAMLGGSAHIGAGAWVAPSVAVMNQARIGAGAVIGLGAVVVKEVAPGTTVVGNPAKVLERKEKGS
jgi:UDP-3-O-[3-hydroxymyristoyl] glucosamine N-acyltransferase